MPRRRRVRLSGDRGTSLAEVLAALAVSTVVLGAAATMFNASLQSNRSSIERVDTVNAARTSAAAMARTLRVAVRPGQAGDPVSTEPAFLQGRASFVRFYANVDNASGTVGPSRVTYDTASGALVQAVQRPTLSGGRWTWCDDTLATCPVQRQVLSARVSTARPLFTYHDRAGAPLPLDPACGCLSATNRGLVHSVEVTVVVPPPSGGRTGPTTYVTRVSLPNQDAHSAGAS